MLKLTPYRAVTPPLGLLTLAALTPPEFHVTLCDENAGERVDYDTSAQIVGITGYNLQNARVYAHAERFRARGKTVVFGGPLANLLEEECRPHCDVLFRGEAEYTWPRFLRDYASGHWADHYVEEEKIHLPDSPPPRLDLLRRRYWQGIVQCTRGCPFTCEFCDIIELYGRSPRTKTHDQILAELETLYKLGYRGHVDFVDDNLIGNKKAIKAFLPVLEKWIERYDYPFEFTTEASLNLADDDELLAMLKRSNFFAIFVGIESPDTETLIAMRKKQNTRRSIPDSVHKIYHAGMFVTAGFIVGFDTERGSVAEPMVELIEESAIPIAMVGLLYALPNTQLTRRLAKEGRLYVDHDSAPSNKGDQCTAGVNYETKRSRLEILRDYRQILEKVYDPDAFCGRLERLSAMLDCSDRRKELPEGDIRRRLSTINMVHELLSRLPEGRERFWKAFTTCMKQNPNAVRGVVTLMAFYLHVGPYSRYVMKQIDRQIEDIEQGRFVAPELLPAVAPEPAAPKPIAPNPVAPQPIAMSA